MDPARLSVPDRLLDTLERLFRIPNGDLKTTLTHVGNLVAEATGCDKVDAFLYDARRDSLVAVASSTQPLSMLQRKLGLDVLPLSNGGCTAQVFNTGEPALHGDRSGRPHHVRAGDGDDPVRRLEQAEAEPPGQAADRFLRQIGA